jgi:hypothetical protein
MREVLRAEFLHRISVIVPAIAIDTSNVAVAVVRTRSHVDSHGSVQVAAAPLQSQSLTTSHSSGG